MNLKIKFRESFRPFAPSVLRECADSWFVLPPDTESPYMLLVADVRSNHRVDLSEDDRRELADPDLRHRVNVVRSSIPAVTHVDYSARIQTVDAERNPLFYKLLKRFYRATGCPIVVNTSFNVRGEPIVASPQDAFRCFMATDIDLLAMGSFLVTKTQQENAVLREEHLARFESD